MGILVGREIVRNINPSYILDGLLTPDSDPPSYNAIVVPIMIRVVKHYLAAHRRPPRCALRSGANLGKLLRPVSSPEPLPFPLGLLCPCPSSPHSYLIRYQLRALFAYSQHHTVAVAPQVWQTVRRMRADRPPRAPLHSGRALPRDGPRHTIGWTRLTR